ncbi:Amidase [Penicillium macrosclerotiorum]|uniref:Amidase n=1 Tax=Penicillium macrosclerotiorum TaxID=303699 RepID=UPI0025486B06|nr:Amidase [Penicillium macrosclerotiorum]KAJ5676039.1 Amidase [Penicillium macrosclerotiorum]
MSSVTITEPHVVKEDFPTPAKPWEDIRDEKRAEQLSRIPQSWRLEASQYPSKETVDVRPIAATSGILSERELEITGETYDATSLATEIAKGTFTSVETVTAFCKRAAICQQICSALTEIFFADAIEKAKQLDEHFKQTGKTLGPLHGVPMTFKECFHVKGYDASNGYISRCFDPSTTTTPIIQLVEDAGAVIIAKTNVPQTMLVAECENNVFGRTRNPIVSHLTCGGSSGGEGSLSAFRGNALGIGTDVGGSIRLPAAYNNVYGYKPSVGILPFIGYAASGWTGVNTGIPAVLGPIAHSVRDIKLFTEVVRARQPWLFDPAIIPGVMESPIPAQDRKPIIGILHESGVTPHPPVRRAIREAKLKVEAAGYETRDFTPLCPDFKEIREIASQLFTVDALSYQRRELARAGEPVVSSVTKFGFFDISRKTHEETWQWNTKKGEMQKKMLDAWQHLGIDVLIAPAAPHAPVSPDNSTTELYTVVWNAVDYPAIIIPFTKADPALDPKDDAFQPKHPMDQKIQALYDPQLMAGAPVSLQLVAPRLQDAALLMYSEMLDKVLNGEK